MLANIQDNTHKAYVALQSYVTTPANIPIPGAVHTDRPKLTRKQIAARYLKSVKGNSDIDINKSSARGEDNKAPKMVQKSHNSEATDQWPSITPRDTSSEIKTHAAVRTLMDAQNCESGSSVSSYLAAVGKSGKLTYEFVGFGDPDTVCLADTPEFIICSDQYLSSAKTLVSGYPSQQLQVRSYLTGDTAANPEKINTEIHNALQKNKATRVYLTPAQLDSYISWQLAHGGSLNFQYIRVEDTEKVNSRTGLALGGAATAFFSALTAVCGVASICTRKDKKLDEKNNHDDSPKPGPVPRQMTDHQMTVGARTYATVTTPAILREVSTTTEESSYSGEMNDAGNNNPVTNSKFNDVVVDIPN